MDAKEFHKLNVAETRWIDWNNSMQGNRGITTNPDYILSIFLEICEDKDHDLHQEMVRHITMNMDYYGRRIIVPLIMQETDIIDWLQTVAKDTTPLDEIGLYVLCNMLDVHATMYRKHRLWSTLELKGANEDTLLANSELVFVWVDPGQFCVVRKKRSAPIKPPQFAGQVTVDPKTLQLVYTPWNVSQNEVEKAISKLDSKLVKREPIVQVQGDAEESAETQTEERTLGTIVNYEELRELYMERSPRKSDTETSSNDDDIDTKPVMDSDQEHDDDMQNEADHGVLPPSKDGTSNTTQNLTGTTESPVAKGSDTACLKVECGEIGKDTTEPGDKLTDVLDLKVAMTIIKDTMARQEVTKAFTATDKRVSHTLEDAIWKENTKDFLIVSDDVLMMPDCTFMIRSLSDKEIEIHVDPKKQ